MLFLPDHEASEILLAILEKNGWILEWYGMVALGYQVDLNWFRVLVEPWLCFCHLSNSVSMPPRSPRSVVSHLTLDLYPIPRAHMPCSEFVAHLWPQISDLRFLLIKKGQIERNSLGFLRTFYGIPTKTCFLILPATLEKTRRWRKHIRTCEMRRFNQPNMGLQTSRMGIWQAHEHIASCGFGCRGTSQIDLFRITSLT